MMLMNKIECTRNRRAGYLYKKKAPAAAIIATVSSDSGCILFRSYIKVTKPFFFHPSRHNYIHFALLYDIMARDNFSFAHYLFTLRSISCSTRFPFFSRLTARS